MKIFTKITIFLFVFTLFSCGKESQMIKGTITNDNQQPLEDVMVQVIGTDLYAKSKEDGSFMINTKKRGDELLFNLEGYKLYFLKLDKNTSPLEIQLQEK